MIGNDFNVDGVGRSIINNIMNESSSSSSSSDEGDNDIIIDQLLFNKINSIKNFLEWGKGL